VRQTLPNRQKEAESRTSPGSIVRRFSTFAATGYGAIVLALFFMQDAMIFPGGGPLHRTPEDIGVEFLSIEREVLGDTTIGWYMPVENARGTVLFSHGNGENISDGLHQAELYQSLGLNCLMYDYGGYGSSTGKPSEARCYADARAMWDWLVDVQETRPESIILAGRSLGGGVTTQLAAVVSPGGVILESTFTSLPQIAQNQFAWLPAKALVRHKFDNGEAIAKVTAPLLIVHGNEDRLIPIEHGRQLFELANEPKEFLAIQGGHNDAHIRSHDAYTAALSAFFDSILGPHSAD
jgi:uncharacterized protein